MSRIFSSIFQPLKDFLFAASCFHCGNKLKDGENRICSPCWDSLSEIKENDHTVQVLKKRFHDGGNISDFVSLYYFEKHKVLQSLAHSLKYEEVTMFGVELGRKLGAKIQESEIEIDCIIPVPLNKRKERERGYNQSDFIAKGIAEVLNVPVYAKAVQRVRYTVTQTKLSAEERKLNLADAFEVVHSEKLKNKKVLIVDDVITTGSTIQEMAKVSKDCGTEKIIAGSVGLAKLGEDG